MPLKRYHHLNFFQHECEPQARVPRVRLPDGRGLGIGRLPRGMLFPLGRHLGRIAFRFWGRRRRITETILRLCFPELDAPEVTAMARRVFEAVTLGVLEFCVAWMNPLRDLRGRIKVAGVEHFRAAMAQGRGVVLLGAHFGCLDIISQSLADLGRIDVMYRYNKNPVLECVQLRGRRHYYRGLSSGVILALCCRR